MNRGRFAPILEDCLHRLDMGETLQVVLDDHPEKADRLKTLLGLALVSRALPKPTPGQAAMRAGINHLLEEMNTMQRANGFRKMEPKPTSRQVRERWLGSIPALFQVRKTQRLAPIYRLVVIGLVVIIAGSVLTVNASASSLPGDVLYDLKLGVEQARMLLTLDEEAKGELALVFERERLSEVEALMASGRSEQVKFNGRVEEMGESIRVISGIPVQLPHETKVNEKLEKGTEVKVEAITQEDGTLLALTISADDDDLPKGQAKDKETGQDQDKETGQDKDKETGQGKEKIKDKKKNR